MKRARWEAYPLLAALVPLFSLAAHNPREYDYWDLATIAVVVLLVFGALVSLLWLALRRFPPATAAAVAFVIVGWFYGYPTLHQMRGGVPIATVMTLAGLVWLARARPALEGFGRFMTSMTLMLLGWSAFLMVRQLIRGPAMVARSPLVRALAQPIRINAATPARSGPFRDIYLVVLDEYAATTSLQEHLGFDNRPFEDSLRALGFTIPLETRSNYQETLLSIPSLLNFEHLTSLEPDRPGARIDPAILFYLAAHSRAAPFLKAQGYNYVILSNWSGTQSSPYADVILRPARASLGLDQLDRTELRSVFLESTVLGPFLRPNLESDQAVLRGFELLKEVPRWSEPTFTVAHFLLPHPPYRFDPTCAPSKTPRRPPRRTAADRIGYRNQVQCTNRQVLALVHALLERSSEPPIILLQADHGSKAVEPDYATVGDSQFQAVVHERFAAFGAYYLPAGGDSLFKGRVTTVNVLRNVLVHYFGAELPLRPDSSYFFDSASRHFVSADFRLSQAR